MVAMVELLLRKDANGNHRERVMEVVYPLSGGSRFRHKIGSTAVYEASSRGDARVVKLLLAVVGIDVNPIVTLWSESESIATNLGESDDDQDYLQHTPLLMAIARTPQVHGHKKVVEMLLAHPH
ncbi:MAG: hypothetical protein QMC37_12605, partial [Flavobacteriales bacterium]